MVIIALDFRTFGICTSVTKVVPLTELVDEQFPFVRNKFRSSFRLLICTISTPYKKATPTTHGVKVVTEVHTMCTSVTYFRHK